MLYISMKKEGKNISKYRILFSNSTRNAITSQMNEVERREIYKYFFLLKFDIQGWTV